MKIFIGTGSATYGAKALRVLENAGVRCRSVRRTHEGVTGCGWGVEAEVSDAESVVQLLRDNGVKITVVKRNGS